jgi:hypothetical protein
VVSKRGQNEVKLGRPIKLKPEKAKKIGHRMKII